MGAKSTEARAKQDKQDAEEVFEKIPLAPNEVQQSDLFDEFPYGVPKSKRLIGGLLKDKRIKISKRTIGSGKKKYVFYSRLESSSESSSDVIPELERN